MSNLLIKKLMSTIDDNSGIELFADKKSFDQNLTWAPSGSSELDFNLGTLGFPFGLVEIAGKSRSGKTTMGLVGMKNFQAKYKDSVCFILSSERRDNKPYAKKIGVDVENVIIIKSHYVEDLFYKLQIQLNKVNTIWKEMKLAGKPKVYILWDSIGGTLSRAETETFSENVKITEKNMADGTHKELKHAQMAAFAKNSKNLVKSMLGQLYDNEMIMVGINHTGVDFNSGNRKSFGGEWVEFLPTIRLMTELVESIKLPAKDGKKDIEVEVAQKTKVKVIKNDFGSRKPTMIEILLGVGIVLSENDIEYAVSKNILKRDGARKVSFMGDKLKWSTKREFYQNYLDDNKFLPILHKKIEQTRHAEIIKIKKAEDE
jgi:RecA/RadA recombinase